MNKYDDLEKKLIESTKTIKITFEQIPIWWRILIIYGSIVFVWDIIVLISKLTLILLGVDF